MARHVGAEIWKRFQIPVYLYEAAATTPERQNLETFVAASSREFVTTLQPTRRASLTSVSHACIPRPEPPWWARASFSWLQRLSEHP